MLKRVQLEQPEGTLEQKKLAAHICCLLANHARSHENDTQQAIKYHKEALIYCESDTKVYFSLHLCPEPINKSLSPFATY